MTDQTTTVPDLDNLAPYPRRATEDARTLLARHYTVEAFAGYVRAMRVAGDLGALIVATKTYFDAFSLAYALRSDAGPDEVADYLVWADDGDDETIHDVLVGWLREYGVDPDVIIRAVRAEIGGEPA